MGWTSTYRQGKPVSKFVTDLFTWDGEDKVNVVIQCKIVKLHTAYLAIKTYNKEIVKVNNTPFNQLPLLLSELKSESGLQALTNKLKGGPDLPDHEVWAGVILLHYNPRSHFDISYKEMSEESGPCERECPESILKLLTPTTNEYASAWRKDCWKRISLAKAQPRLQKGCLVKFERPIKFTDRERDVIKIVDAFRQKYTCPITGSLLRLPRDVFRKKYQIIKELPCPTI